MISVQEAEQFIEQNRIIFPRLSLPLSDVQGKILLEGIYADRHSPPFHRVCMDGIAISMESWKSGQRTFLLEGLQKAGDPAIQSSSLGLAIEVMTGAPLPEGLDVVIPYEELKIPLQKHDRMATLREDLEVKPMQNIQPLASEHRQGDLLIPQGTLLQSPHVGIAASVGKIELWVSGIPSIAIVSTGDELVEVEQTPLPYQIRRSNSWALQAEILSHFSDSRITLFQLPDDELTLRTELKKILEDFPIVILSGGVSKGKFDFVPQALQELQVKKIFHGVRQRPGKPFWFGVKPGRNMVFGLPGNPCSCLTTLRRYVIPFLSSQLSSQLFSQFSQHFQAYAVLAEDFTFTKPLTLFLPVQWQWNKEGMITVIPVSTQGSGDYGSLGKSQGFIELPEDSSYFLKGRSYPLYSWGSRVFSF